MIGLKNYYCCLLIDVYLPVLVDIFHILHLFDVLEIHENLSIQINLNIKNFKEKKKDKIL